MQIILVSLRYSFFIFFHWVYPFVCLHYQIHADEFPIDITDQKLSWFPSPMSTLGHFISICNKWTNLNSLSSHSEILSFFPSPLRWENCITFLTVSKARKHHLKHIYLHLFIQSIILKMLHDVNASSIFTATFLASDCPFTPQPAKWPSLHYVGSRL